MLSIFDSPIPQHTSKAEESVWDEENGKNEDATEQTDDTTASENYVSVLGVKIGYSDAKAIAGMEVVEVFGSYLPENVLGMTDCSSKIWIRYGLGYLKKHVLVHEIEHVKDPAASEYVIRLRAKQIVPTNLL
ncbi:MAG: hypothetical protein HY516_03230 [Candidatus Aenigmarchaeota archaeon]|nr:hypothetical protein [Candidatus Aenigmarchaeota archaeon]